MKTSYLLVFTLLSCCSDQKKADEVNSENTQSSENNEAANIQFISKPSGAKIFINGILSEEVTPTRFKSYNIGDKVLYRFEKEGYITIEREFLIPSRKYHIFEISLQASQ